MSEIIDLEDVRRARESERTIVLALDDSLYDGLGALKSLPTEIDGLRVRYVRASVGPEGLLPDAVLVRYVPTAPGREQLFQCEDGCVYEQDAEGVVYARGERLWPGAPAAVGAPRSAASGRLLVGEEAALLFFELRGRSVRMCLRITSPVARVVRVPRVLRPDFPDAWLHAAGGLIGLGEVPDGC